MLKKLILSAFLFGYLTTTYATATHDIAITIDDLPFVGEQKNFHLNMIIDTLTTEEVPATGFVIARDVRPDNWPVLQKFKEAGLGIGNHTWSHANAQHLSAASYIQQIDSADKKLGSLITQPKYFRYPYLAMGEGDKKEDIKTFLASKHYRIAPITIDSQDFIFNQLLLSVSEAQRRHFLEVLKPCYLDFMWQQTLKAMDHKKEHAQILLIHSNLLNAYVLPDIIQLYRSRGFHFVSLQEALST